MDNFIEFAQSETEKIISDKIDQIFSQPLEHNYLEYLVDGQLYVFIIKLHNSDKYFRVYVETNLHTQYIDKLKFTQNEYKTLDDTMLKPAKIIEHLKNKHSVIVKINSLTVALAHAFDDLDNNKINIRYSAEILYDDIININIIKYAAIRLNNMITNPII